MAQLSAIVLMNRILFSILMCFTSDEWFNAFLHNCPRYPTKGRITTPQMKVVTLLQAELNDFVVLEAGLQQESNKALKIFTRCAAGESVKYPQLRDTHLN